MGVPCPGCGRSYDVTLFDFGRTLQCTCGARVRHEPRRAAPPGHERLLADAMLGRLATWLRLFGLDCAWDPAPEDAELVRRALEEQRVLLTRDRGIAVEWSLPALLCLRAEQLEEQLVEVIGSLGLAARVRLFTRCSRCNLALEPVSERAVATRLPEGVRRASPPLRRCPGCERIYWEGSHTERVRRVAERVLARIASR